MVGAGPGSAAVVGHLDDTPIGYAYTYGCTLPADTRWWNGPLTSVPDGAIVETGARAFGPHELMVAETSRGTNVAHQIHDGLLRGRPEEPVTSMSSATTGQSAARTRRAAQAVVLRYDAPQDIPRAGCRFRTHSIPSCP
ncbi:hypothetical protein AB9Q10_27435 [Streptomyces krungchingensis]|uniref:hypothetical protein n=1 Tax=Streptomyces krungchingensis TaxID=1565034 RepID=UPI003CEB16A2